MNELITLDIRITIKTPVAAPTSPGLPNLIEYLDKLNGPTRALIRLIPERTPWRV